MDTLIDQLSHPKAIWYTFGRKRYFYIPYLIQAVPQNKKQTEWLLQYNGGEVLVALRDTAHIMFYGASGDIPLAFLDACRQEGVSVSVHRTHIAEPFVAWPSEWLDRDDVLTRQILARENEKQKTYIARQLVRAKVLSQQWLRPVPQALLQRIAASRNVESLRLIEAEHTRTYWDTYFSGLGMPEESRRSDGPVQAALDAGSHFVSGIILRWVISSQLSPAHGFLHSSTGYPALVSDLLEPYRWWIDRAIFDLYLQNKNADISDAISRIKDSMDSIIKTEPTRQSVHRRALLHGSVLALVHYLDGSMQRYMPPVEVGSYAGRKRITSYHLVGEIR